MSENKITSFEDWFNNHEFNHFKTGSHKERCEIAWTACAKMKDEEIEKLMVLQTELEAKNYDLQKENEALKKKLSEAAKVIIFYSMPQNFGYNLDVDDYIKWISDEKHQPMGNKAIAFLKGNKDELQNN